MHRATECCSTRMAGSGGTAAGLRSNLEHCCYVKALRMNDLTLEDPSANMHIDSFIMNE